MNYYERAQALNEEIIKHRRFFHTNAEVGLDMPKAQTYVMETLNGYGLKPQKCGYGVTATVGKGEKTILLRADMDALPMKEESGLSFACPTGEAAHTCGHDFHAAMLLVAAKLLKENETNLNGMVRFMFQTAEETLEGAKNMIENGILEPLPDAALSFHVTSGRMPVGACFYNNLGTMMNSVDGFEIIITGKGAHGAYPQDAIDPILAGTHIYLALESLIAREANPNKSCVLTVGNFQAGSAPNIIPETAVLQGTIRTNDTACRERLVRRMKEVSYKTAEALGARAEVKMLSEVPPLICDKHLTESMISYMEELGIPDFNAYNDMQANASEDFAVIVEKVPGTMIYLSAGFSDDRGNHPAHNSKVLFNEEVCPVGAAAYAHLATQWLKGQEN